MGIKFGTDGWRAVMAEDFTFSNVEIVTQGIADYVKNLKGDDHQIFIGYDNRFLSPEFAQRAAEVLAGNGIKVLISNKAVPTPTTAFSVVKRETIGALMFTASHNPPEYNGLKFIPDYAGPALPEITAEIEKKVKQVQDQGNIKRMPYRKGKQEEMIRLANDRDAYLEQLKSLVDQEAIKNAGLKILVDPMYGAGAGYLDKLLSELGCEVEAICNYRDPLFGGKMPEPAPSVLKELSSMVKDNNYHLGLALDGDADRFGIIDYRGEFINANQVLSMLYHHLLNKGIQGPVTKTVSTTHMLNRIANEHNQEVFETPVGFKFIGKNLRDEDCVLGGEESGGLSIRGHIPEKDGILACLLIVEIIAKKGDLKGYLDQIYEEYGTLVNERLDIHVSEDDKSRVLEILETWRPKKLANHRVIDFNTVDGLKIECEDDSWILIRPSGTEPLFRIYGETNSWRELEVLQKEIRNRLEI
ncbi:phosphoglucomutase/phosphomannomutase family protein [Natranaerobius thermophilus]|uniref:Phosphoglucomutase n=1 Tax=Natranaerobius thermophilus (strain ATCC BAA-1301 / DSM 18059 / JW/NM-WN-LF) TaxID=457570 RepID=B2A1H5_NATTJ|nr:phosphoglucomutase/phosphomannomutase family protein [Natranaerobius thermophilus]ACB84715.1 Phosphoglucomutase [Natranaerobius thermophilus JW/NM-WN-LF]